MAASTPLEQYEIEIPVKCVGCEHRDDWDEKQFLQLRQGELTRKIAIRKEPENPVNSEAIAVLFAGRHCGYIADANLSDFNHFYKAFQMMQPYILEYSYGFAVETVHPGNAGRIGSFDMVAKAVAFVPSNVAEEIDSL